MARIQIQSLQKNKKRDRNMLIVAIALGLVALFLNVAWKSSVEGARMRVLRAKETIVAGTKFNRDQFEVITITGDLVGMKSTFLDVADLPAYEQKTILETMLTGQLLSLRSFNGGGLQLPPNKSAFSVNVQEEAAGVGYLLRPGDAVDVWGWIGGKQNKLREGACVAAVGDVPVSAGPSDGREFRYRSVTIIVDADEVEALLTNLQLADTNVKLVRVGMCDQSRQSKAIAPLTATPAPTPDVTPTPTETNKPKGANAQGKRKK